MASNSWLSWDDVRTLFPAVHKYTYLNTAESGPISTLVAEAGRAYYEESLQQADMNWDEWVRRMESARESVARYLNADKEEIAFTLSASHGMNLVADMLKDQGEVLSMGDEFPSSTLPWLHRGVPMHFIPADHSRYSIDRICEAIQPKTGVLVSSHVQYKTGFRQDIESLGAVCQEKGLVFALNATQSMGSVPIDVRKAHVDFLVFNSLKWVMAGYGIGVLYMNRKWLDKVPKPVAGWLSVNEPFVMNNRSLDLRSDASAMELGCPHVPNIFALGAAMGLLARIGQERILERLMNLNRYLEQSLDGLDIEIISPLEPACRSGITMLKLPEPQVVVDKLRQQGIIVSLRGAAVRVSVHLFNNESDIDALVLALRKMI